MLNKKEILAISGSIRSHSSNLKLIETIADMYKDDMEVVLYESIADLPHFNPDIDNENPPESVKHFRTRLAHSDGILICTPEYAMGLPGVLKNALDWTVSSCEFSHKPVVAITASSLGEKAHQSLLLTLHIIEAALTDQTQLLIPYIKTKINDKGEFIDEATRKEVMDVMDNFKKMLNKEGGIPSLFSIYD